MHSDINKSENVLKNGGQQSDDSCEEHWLLF